MDHAIVVDGRRYPGITKTLERAFYANYPKRVGPRKRKGGSSKAKGELVHRQIFHAFHCAKQTRCECKERFGRRTPDRHRKALPVILLREFLKKHHLEFWKGEVAVAWPELGLATFVDGVARHRLTGRLYVLEYKTGYPKQTRRRPASSFALDDRCKLEGATTLNNCPYNHHQLQVWFGVEALRRTLGKEEHKVEDGILFYFDRTGVDVHWHNHWRAHDAADEPPFEEHLAKHCNKPQ